MERCDGLVLAAADALLSVPVTGPLSWDELNAQVVDDSTPSESANLDAQLDLLDEAIADLRTGLDDLVAGRPVGNLDCTGLGFESTG